MEITATKTTEEIRAQIVQQLRNSLKIDPETKLSDLASNSGIQELRAQILQKARESMGLFSQGGKLFSGADSKFPGVEIDVIDMRTRMLFSRIKNSRMPKQQRDALSGFLRSMAIEGKVDKKAIQSLSEMIFVLEMSANYDRKKEFAGFPVEKSVDDEMKTVYKTRDQRDSMKERLDALKTQFS